VVNLAKNPNQKRKEAPKPKSTVNENTQKPVKKKPAT